MLRSTTVLITMSLLAVTALVSSGRASAQQAWSAAKLDAFVPGAMPQPPKTNPFQAPGKNPDSTFEGGAHADAMPLLQLDRAWSTTYVQYSFAAPPDFYNLVRPQTASAQWDSALTGVFAADINHSGAFLRMTTNLELAGERRPATAPGNPGGQVLTMEWELGHLVHSRFGCLEFSSGVYRQSLLSHAAFANTAISETPAGYHITAVGVESSFTLPDSNLTLTFRRGSQHLNATDRKRSTMLDLSWSW